MRISDWSSDVCSSDLRWQSGRDSNSQRPDVASPDTSSPAVQRRGEIGRASGRERVCQYVSITVVTASLKKNKQYYTIITPIVAIMTPTITQISNHTGIRKQVDATIQLGDETTT